MSFEWDFGDGEHARTSAGQISHRYASGGQYVVVVTATNPTGAAVGRRAVVISADQAAWRPRRLLPIVIRVSR
jgi:PKD repeat protein